MHKACWSKLMSWFSMKFPNSSQLLRAIACKMIHPVIKICQTWVYSIFHKYHGHGMSAKLANGKTLLLNFWKLLGIFRNFPEIYCHCNEIRITILPINQVWKHIYIYIYIYIYTYIYIYIYMYGVCPAQSLLFLNKEECHINSSS